MDINIFPCTHCDSHVVLLREIEKKLSAEVKKELQGLEGCFVGTGINKAIKKLTHARALKKLGQVSVEYNRTKVSKPHGEKRHIVIIRDSHMRSTWVHFIHEKFDAVGYFEAHSAGIRTDGVPSIVEIVRFDMKGELGGGAFRPLSVRRGIK